MTHKTDTIVHREVIELEAPPQKIREFIMTPERILDYYPGGIDGEIIEAGKSFYCRGVSGVSLLDFMEEDSHDKLIVLKVFTATKLSPPFTAERIRKAAFFTMVEDWHIEPLNGGTQLRKTWRDLHKLKYRLLPMSYIVRHSAKSESPKLKAAWDAAARASYSPTTE